MTFEQWFEKKTEWLEMTDGLNWGAWEENLRKAYNAGFKEGYRLGEDNCLPDFDEYED